jgi:cytochrome c peroxidase
MRRDSICTLIALAITAAALSGCRDDSASSFPTAPTAPTAPSTAAFDRKNDDNSVARIVRQLATGRGIVRLANSPHVRPELSQLGQALAFDPILSGNKNMSCMTCHMPAFETGDGRSLSIGTGGQDFGPDRKLANGNTIPRNAPPMFNLGAMRHLFWDGRIQLDDHGLVQTPAGAQVTPAMERAFDFGPISAIAMFPVTNRVEMRGQLGTNELAAIDDANNPAIWSGIMKRIGAIPEYRRMFERAYPGKRFEDLTFANASNAIGAFIVDKLSFNDTPWDRFLSGNDHALSKPQLAGAQTFLALKCSICHNGATLSDDKFHDVAVAQIGPGEGDGAGGHDDFGRMRVTGLASDRYLFRTTPLRNVELTAPYGHDGSITTLKAFIQHYSNSDLALQGYDPSQLIPSLRSSLLPTTSAILAQRDTLLNGVVLTDSVVTDLVNYMSALTDDAARHLDNLVPQHVPSRLPVIPKRP